MGNYVRATLTRDEYVLYEATISLWSQLPLILVDVCLLVSMAFLTTTASVPSVLVMLAVGLGLIPLVVVFLRYKSTELCITNLRIIANFGLFSRHSIEMKLARVESIQLRQGIFGRLFNYGSLVISGAGNPMAPVPNISKPLEFRRVAMEAHEHQGESAQTYPYRSAGGGGVRLMGFVSLGLAVIIIFVALKHVLSGPPKEVANAEFARTQTGQATSYARSKSSPSTPSSKNAAFKTYANERYGFRIDYPQSFVAGQTPENGDGIKFESPDSHAELVVSGSNDPGQGLAAYYSDSMQSIKGELGFHASGTNWFVITWKDGETLSYQKTFVGSASENSFTMTFPVNEKSTYDDVVTHVENPSTTAIWSTLSRNERAQASRGLRESRRQQR